MNVLTYMMQEAANDSHIESFDYQSNLQLRALDPIRKIYFFELAKIAIEKEARKKRLGEITDQTFNMFCSRVNSNMWHSPDSVDS